MNKRHRTPRVRKRIFLSLFRIENMKESKFPKGFDVIMWA